MIPFLASKNNITVVTNGVKALLSLAEYGINTISSGGNLVSTCLALVGEEAHKTIESINADIAFFSCRGVSENGELTDIFPYENYVRSRIIKNSKGHICYVQMTSFAKSFFIICAKKVTLTE